MKITINMTAKEDSKLINVINNRNRMFAKAAFAKHVTLEGSTKNWTIDYDKHTLTFDIHPEIAITFMDILDAAVSGFSLLVENIRKMFIPIDKRLKDEVIYMAVNGEAVNFRDFCLYGDYEYCDDTEESEIKEFVDEVFDTIDKRCEERMENPEIMNDILKDEDTEEIEWDEKVNGWDRV